MTTRALVLGSGGLTGIAWEAGVLCRLDEERIDPTTWHVVIGSSAGAFVGACLLAGRIVDLYDVQLAGGADGLERELTRALDNRLLDALRLGRRRGLHRLPEAWALTTGLAALARYALARGPGAARGTLPGLRALGLGRLRRSDDIARLGELLSTAHPKDNQRWVDYWEHLLGSASLGSASLGSASLGSASLGSASAWPTDALVVTAIDLASGAHVSFDRSSGIPLARAVAASTAIPFVIAPVTINGRRYGDGGVGSATNAGLAAGHDQVLILAPVDRGTVASEVESLRALGADVVPVRPGGSAAALGAGLITLDPRRRAASARAGYDDGAHLAERLRSRDRAPSGGGSP